MTHFQDTVETKCVCLCLLDGVLEVGHLEEACACEETRRCRGLTLLIDARRAGAWREVRGAIRLAEERLSTGSEEEIHTPTGEGRSSPDAHPSVGPQNNIIVIRPDSGAFFWSKQRGSTVHCARSGNSEAQPIYVTLSRLLKYVENSQLPEDLGGSWPFDLDLWIQNRIYTEAFVKDAVGSLFDLEKVCARLSVLEPGARVSSTEDAFCLARAACNTAIDASAKVLLAGKGVLQALDVNYVGSSWKNGHYKMPQDILDSKDKVEKLLEAVRSGEKKMKDAWATVEKQFGDAREANALEDGVKRVTDWILGPAELLLNSHSADVGSDIASSEELRLRHEALEMLCRETYGQYAELLHKIDCLPLNNIALPKDLKSQRDFMDFVCRSFASRLERRRNILITCLRFYRLVAEYFDRTSEVFETYVSHEDIEDFESADSALHDLQDNQTAIDAIEQEVLREGEKLTDLLCMPAKDALGRDLGLSREGAILEVRGVLRATAARARIFGENVELQKLRLEQISHIRAYEKDATQAMQWLDELFQVLLESHSHVGCNVTEIQSQKEQHQAFQETAKGTYEYGCQLVSASLSLRQSCELPTECNERLGGELWRSWDRLQAVGREQMTRLRVSAVFHRSVQEHCSQLIELMEKVKETRGNLASNGASGALCSLTKGRKGEMSTMANPMSLNDTAAVNDTSSAGQSLQGSMRRLLARREKLLMEVGRMVRLGRLLRTRLREPLYPPADSTQGSEAVQEKSSSEEDTAWSHAALGGTEAPNSSSSSQANSEPYNNATAVEAISEKLSEVTALAEALDNSLCASTPSSSNSPHAANGKSRRRPFHTTDTSSYSYSALLDTSGSSSSTTSPGHTHHRSTLRSSHSVTSSGRRMATSDGLASGTVPSAQDAYTRMKAEGAEEDDEEEEFVTASECTRSPSRSSSYHTASDGGGGGSGTGLNVAHWWQEDDVEDDDVPVVQDEETARTSELDTSDKQGDDDSLPQPPPPPPLPPAMGKIGMLGRRGSSKGRETTESTLTQLRVTQSHSLGITSYVLTSETIKDTGKGEGDITSNGFDHKNNIDVASETSLCTSSLDQSSTETLQNGTSIGVLSEEELTRQMEESRDWLQLKIVEAVPEPSRLGSSLAEAVSLQRAHDNVLTQLQSKQSPVEELLRQADQLISSQHPRAEVYAAMAESLGLAWKDVNTLLELRKTVLDLNVAYHSRAEECLERMNILESECHREDGEFSEEDSELVKAALTRLHDMRKGMLESLSAALQEGKALLGKTREIAVSGTLDSRPDKIRGNAEYAVSQVEHWLETLHDQRQALEGPWRDYRSILERRLALSLLASDLTSLENALHQARDINLLQREEHIYDLSLGDSSSSAELLLHEHKKMDSVAMDLRDRALKITKATEHLVSTGPAPGGQSSSERRATSRAYAVLGGCTDFGEIVEQRAALLMKAIAFFRSAQAAQTKLDQLEVQLCTMPKGYGLSNSQLASLHSQAAKALDDTVEAPIREGYEILKEIGNENAKGIQGIKHAIEELEKRKIRLGDMCTAHKEENVRLSQALTLFLEKQNDLYSWLVSIAEAFLQGHQDMGSVYPMAQDFLELHKKLLNDLNLKGTEIEALLSTLPPILEWLEGEQRADVACKASALRLQWVDLRALLEARIDLCTPYVGFHSLASRLVKEIDSAEDGFKEKHIKAEGNGRNGDDVEAEQRWLSIQQLFLQLTNTGKNFLQDAEKATDPYLDIKRACLCVQTLLEHLGSRQLVVNEAWEEWQQRITIRREFQVQWERTMTESSKTIEWVSKLEAQFYPVIRGQSSSSRVIARELEERLQSFIPEVKRAQSEIELRVKTIETLTLKGDTQGQKDLIVKKLNELHQKFQLISTEYQILVQMLIAFFKNMSELDRRIENLQSQYRSSFLPRELPEAESQLKDHEASRQAVLELFKFTQTESEQIISRIHQQEPFEPGKQDAEKVMQLLEGKRAAWEAAWAERRAQLEQCLQRCQFDCDLRQINSQLSDLGRQLSAIRGQYGESLSTAQATSLAFVYFEKTIEILEQRIRTFVSTAEQAGSGTRHGNLDDLDDSYTESHIHRELTQLQARWSAFHSQVVESRRLINLSIEYFTLVEEAERWFKDGSKLLVTIARKSTTVRTPEEATQLLNEVEMFLKPGEIRQDERIKKISALAVELYGEEKSKQVKLVLLENREMLDSFTIINEELNSLAENLKAAEMQRLLQKKEQEEVDASLSAARAEAAAASAAAAAAEEARKAAEAAAKALSEAAAKAIHDATIAQQSLIERVEVHRIETVTSAHDIINEIRKKTPSPVQKPKIEDVPVLIAPSFTLALHDCTVQEGDRLLLECKVIGDPLPEIVWYKDGISIQSNPDYHTTYNQGICSLSIEETFAEDSAKFTCKATNSAGTAETSAMLTVKEAELQDQLSPPLFTRNLVPSTAKEGSSYQLECCVSGNPLPTVQWFKGDVCIDSSPDYSITYNNGEAVLRFEEIFLDDQAEYRCRATNCVGTEETRGRLSVEAIEPSEAPSFVLPLSNVMARAGLKLKLECEVTGLPTPKLTWTHNGKLIKETRDTRIISDGKKEILVISEAFPKDAGVYVVSAKNKCGEASSSCNVSVKGRLPTETSDSELASDMEPIKPSIQVPLRDMTSKEGEQVRLDCVIVGQPEPEVIWYHNERPVKESPDFKLLFQGDRCSLIIKEAYPEDSGEYKVVAINSAGEASSLCQLNIKTSESIPPVVESPPIEPLPVGIAPRFNKLLTDVLVAEGEEVVLECSVHGEPEPKIKWLLNNQEMTSNPNIKFDQDSSGTVSLTIKSASPEDRGVYTVKAINPSGEAKCFANLIVKPGLIPESYRRKTPILELVEKHTVPVFKEIFMDKNVPKGEAVKFECIVTGRPTPKVRWCFDDQPVSGQGFWVSTSGERQVLSIPEALPRLSGKISCIAENEEGRAVCSAILSVEAPIPIEISNEVSRIDLQNQEDEDDRLSSPSFSMKRAVFMQTSSQMQTIKTSSSSFSSTINTKSGEPTVSSQSQSITSQTEKAFKQVGDQPPLQIEAKKIEVMQQVNGNQPMVKQQSSLIISKGEDKQIQEDSFSSGTIEQSLVPLPSPPKPQRKSIAPRFISPLMGRIVDQGTDVTLEAIVDGYPEPTITWLKNGTEELDSSKPDSSVIITFDHGRACLELKAVNVKDAGRYTCKIVNNAGTATSTADLVVKKTVFPPVFGRRLQAQVAKKGQRVVMEVEVTGTPDPTITWSKDGTPIIYNTKPYRIKNQGCCHSVIIDEAVPAHSGRFTVRAVNAGGEAQSSADFVVVEEPPEGSTEQITTYVIQDMQETSRETKQKQPTEKVVVLPRPAVATEVERTVLQAPPMPKDVPKTEIIDTKPNDTLSSSVTEIVLETTQHTEKHVSMKMQHSPFPDFPEPEEKSFSTVGIQSDIYEVMTPDIPTESPKATEPDDDVKQDNDREKRDKELVEIKQQGSVQEALSKFKKLESQIESPIPQKVIQMDDFKQEQTSSETLIIKNISLAPSVPKVGSLMTTGTNIPIELEKPQSIKIEKPLDIVESVLYTPSSSVMPPEEPITIKTLILESGEEIEPGPPPEMGYIPKSEVPSKGQKEEVACKVKKLQEESQKVLSPVEIPSGAVRLFPVSTAAPVHTISSIGTSSSAFSHWIGKESEPVKTVTSIPVMTESPSKPEVPIFSKEPIKETEMTSFKEHTDIQIKDEFKSELIIKPPIDKTEELVIRPRSPIARSLTPGTLVPSAEGVAMEKIWASRKTPEPEVNVLSHSTPSPFQTFHRDNTNSPRPPSAQGVAMDRIWAHKHPERSIKMSWPPQPTAVEEDRTVPVWVSRGKSEPLKCPTSPPVSQQETHHHSSVTDVSVIKEYSSFESSLKQEQICTPVPPTPVQTIKPIPPPPTVQPSKPVPPAPPAEIFKSVPVSSPVQRSAPVPPSLPAEIFKPVQAPKHIPPSPPAEIFKPIPPPPPLQTYKPAPPPPPVQTFKPAPPPPPMQTFKPAPPPEPTFKPASPIEQVIKPAPSSEKIFKPVPQVAKPTPPDSNVLHYVAHVTHLSTAAEQEDALRSVETTSTTKMEISRSHVEKTFEFSSVSGTTKSAEPNPLVVEEKGLKPSEAKKVWPPGPQSEFEPMAPPSIKTGIQPQCYVETSLPKPTFDEEISIQLEPGPPPEIGFMQPTLERRVSKVESIELDLDKEPSKHIVGAVRTIPPPLKDKFKAKKEPVSQTVRTVASPLAKKAPVSDKKPKMIERPMSTPPISLSAFKPFPELEPFPFKPDQSKKTHTKVPPPPKPSKFVKGDFTESDYESDIESTRIPAKWRPYGSDTEGLESHKPTFRRVKPPGSAPPARRPASVCQAPLPPSAFETEPPKLEGPQPEVLKGTNLNEKGLKVQKVAGSKIGKVTQETKKVEKDEITEVTSVKVIKKQMTHTSKQSCVTEIPKRKRSPPSEMSSVSTETALDKDIEQGSEPKSPVKGKPGSPKMKGKKEMTESGYMADTDEPIWQKRMQSKETKSSTVATSSMSSTSMIASKFERKVPDSPQESTNKNSQKVHHHHQASSKFLQQQQIAAAAELIGEGEPTEGEQGVVKKQQKELIAPAIVKEIPLASKDIIYKKDKTQVVPSPSKFVKGEFRVSDYESDYDTRIPPIWRPHESDTDEPSYRSVRPILTCTRKAASVNRDIIPPIPPTKFEEFPQSDGQLSSQLKPFERVSTPIAKISKAISQSIDATDTISHQIRSSSSVSAQPAFSPPVVLPEPGPPPEERYAPPPPQHARLLEDKKKTDKNPLQAVETSKKMHFTESSETCHRVVSMEHTTRVIQFGEKEMKGVVHPIRSQFHPTTETPRLVEIAEPALEPFPFKPEPQKPRQPSGPPPPKPKKFTKGEFRESDYESDVENVRIKPIWVPHDSDSEEPHYRKVRPPSTTPKKSDGSDRGGPSPAPPSEFEKPPELSGPQKVSIPSVDKSARTKVSTTVFKTEAEQKRLMRVEEMKRRFSGGTEMQRQFQPVTKPVDYPDGIILQPGEEPEYGYAGSLPASATQAASHHMSEMSHTFKSKAQQFVNDIMKTTSESSTEPKSNGVKLAPKVRSDEKHDDEPHSYREESRLSQFGTKCIDPDTGLIYFKYDFGYEFGVLLPGEGAGMRAKNAVSGVGTPSKPRDDDIAVPVIHEKSGTPDVKTTSEKSVSKLGGQNAPKGAPVVPQFRPKKFTHLKSVKWEPTSESELSDAEGTLPRGGGPRRLPQPAGGISEPRIIIPTSPSIPPPLSSSPSSWKWVGGGDGGTMSPLSLSPRSLPSFSPHPQQHSAGGTIVAPLRITPGPDSTASPSMTSPWPESGMSPTTCRMGGVQGQGVTKVSQGRGNTPTPPSTPSTPSSAHGVYVLSPSQPIQPRKPPTFITPLKDIAVKSGGTARFECIVQAEPPPNILWSKNGRIIENNPDHEIHYRNGVCRLTIPEAYPEDAGTYTCTATNMLGTIGTTGSLQVPGVPSHKYGTYRQLFTGATSYGGGGSYLVSDPSYPLALALPLSLPPTPADDFASHEWSRGTQSKLVAASTDDPDDSGASLLMGDVSIPMLVSSSRYHLQP